MEKQILVNIQKLHSNVIKDQKSNILSLVAYDNLKFTLVDIGFKFSWKQFKTAKIKREKQEFNLNNYKRFIPYTKTKVNNNDREVIKQILYDNSKESSES